MADWKSELGGDWAAPALAFAAAQRRDGRRLYPADSNVLRALALTPLDRVRVVILGQDPYHGAGQADGLAFSVPDGVKLPPSLRNIYKEIASEVGGELPASGDLSRWASQGVLLLNTTLTVEDGKPRSHAKRGWEEATREVLQLVSDKQDHVVFMLWGDDARKAAAIVDRSKHLVLEAPHPSPLSAYRGFFGCGHFSKANAWLVLKGMTPIRW